MSRYPALCLAHERGSVGGRLGTLAPTGHSEKIEQSSPPGPPYSGASQQPGFRTQPARARLLWPRAVWGPHKGGCQVPEVFSKQGESSTYPEGDVGAQQAASNGGIAPGHDRVDLRECQVCQVGLDQQRSLGLQTGKTSDSPSWPGYSLFPQGWARHSGSRGSQGQR